MPSALAALTIATPLTSSGTLTAGKHNSLSTTAGTALAAALPAPSANGHLTVERTDATTGTVTITGVIRGVNGAVISMPWQYESLEFISDASSWYVVAGHKTKTSLDLAYDPRGAAAVKAPALSGRTAFFGDSITGYGYKYPTLAQALSLGRAQVVGLYSHSGYTTDQLVPLVTEFTQANPKPSNVIILAGTNDAQGTLVGATFRTNLLTIAQAALAASIQPILCTIPPLGSAFSAAKRAQVAAINAQIRILATALNLQVIDFHAVLTDPATGQWLNGTTAGIGTDSGDGVHPAYAGQLAMAQATAAVLQPITPAGGLPLVQQNGDTANLFTNPLALTDADSNGIPDGWDAYNNSTTGLAFSLVADAAIRGKWATITATSRTGQAQIQNRRVGGFTAGDSVYFAALVKTAGLSSNASFGLAVNWWKDYGGEIVRQDQIGNGGPVGSGPGLYAGTFVAPAGATQVSVQLTTDLLSGSSYSGVFQLGQVTGYNLTQLGLS